MAVVIPDPDIEKALDYIRDKAPLVGQLEGQKAYLEHHLKIIQGQEFLKATGTVAEREAIARTMPEYVDKVSEYRDCVTELATVKTYIKAAELKKDVWQTQSANQRRGNI